jgi:glycine/D-amino acid oxidase-like deaminating enzyme
MARSSFAMFQSYLGMPGAPVEWTDRYFLSDVDPSTQRESSGGQGQAGADAVRRDFAHYEPRIDDITPDVQVLPAGSHPFPTPFAFRTSSMTFNVADYTRQLMNDFLIAGGAIETREFHTPQDVAQLPQPVIINCPGYGGRQLWSDESIVPVRGQIAWLIPQPGATYGVFYKDVNVVARRDGIVVQPVGGSDDYGFGDASEEPNRQEAEAGVLVVKELFDRMAAMRRS